MPELPDIVVYVEALAHRVVGQNLRSVRIQNPFVLRTFEPPPETACGRRVLAVRRLGKRIVLGLEEDLWLVIHLMIAGRLQWRDSSIRALQKNTLATFDFDRGTLALTEAGTTRRAGIWLVGDNAALKLHDPGGLEVLEATLSQFRDVLTRENHTLKRALTDPRLFSGIGNAYSDEILHRAGLPPLAHTERLDEVQIARLFDATRAVLLEWAGRLRAEAGDNFPTGVTAFRPGMAVHGRFGQPCPQCGATVQRIRYSENETNYCPRCQNEGRIYADRSLSRLLGDDWPRHLDEL